MSNVVDFKTPSQLRAELLERETEIAELKVAMSRINGVNEMLKLQIVDLSDSLNAMVKNMTIVIDNLEKLATKLPTLDS